MKTALIIHGIGGHAGIHWQQWLRDELKKQGYTVLMPTMPNSGHPDRKAWLATIVETLQDTALEDLTIIGHSLGATTALDFLEQATVKVTKFVSVSGFAKDYGAELNHYFLTEKSIDFEKVKSHTSKAVVIYGDNDPYVTQDALKYIADCLSVQPVIISGGGHLNTEAGFTQLPELIGVL